MSKMATVHFLPKYLANLKQPIRTKKATYFLEIHPCTNNIVYDRFGVVTAFLCALVKNIF